MNKFSLFDGWLMHILEGRHEILFIDSVHVNYTSF